MRNRYAFGYCENCGKKLYASRKLARAAAQAFHQGEHVSPYRCPWVSGAFHLGHLPGYVTRGDAVRAEIRHRPGKYLGGDR